MSSLICKFDYVVFGCQLLETQWLTELWVAELSFGLGSDL